MSVTCDNCKDTHLVYHVDEVGESRGPFMCTRCPVPCQRCRAGGIGAFCGSTPCACVCHVEPVTTYRAIAWDVVRLAHEELARGPRHHDLTRACDLFCCPPQRTAGGMGGPDVGGAL